MAQPTILILGADGPLGHELARLAVAYGARVIGAVPRGERPHVDEPWVHGVEWVADTGDDGSLSAVVVLDWSREDEDPVPESDRMVLVNPPVGVQVSPGQGVVVATPGEILHAPITSLEDVETDDGIRVERLAMALLRAAFDDDIAPRLDHEALVHLGDAVFLQGA